MFYKVRYLLDPRCVLKFKTEKGKEVLSAIWDEVCAKISAERIIKCEVKFNEISIVVCNARDISQEQLKKINDDILKALEIEQTAAHIEEVAPLEIVNSYSLEQSDRKYLLNYVDEDFVQPKKEEGSGNRSNVPPKAEPEVQENVFETVKKLIGMDELKAWAEEIYAFKNLNTDAERLAKPLLSMSYLVSVNEGNGRSTIFETMGKVIADILGRKTVEVKEISIDPVPESKTYNVDKILSDVSYIEAKSDKLYVFALSVDKFQNNNYMGAWIELLSNLRNNPKALFIFTMPYVEKMAINEMHAKIEDILPNRVLAIRPFRTEEYKEFFRLYFTNLKMTVDEDALALVPEFIAEEKTDGRFYGIDTINKVCDELLYEKLKHTAQGGDLSTITREDAVSFLNRIKPADTSGLSGMEKLEALSSLNEVKSRIKEIIASLKMQKSMYTASKSSMHMMFAGPPGTGKTVVARILGQILREEKLLSAGGFYEVTRKDLVGSYVGHTAPKTAEMCHLARGSVLFIDEAYSLDGGGQNDYGKEAISTLIAEMENNRDDFVVVFAGYEKELENLFALNPGLRDRIPYRITFSSYNRDELCDIFYKMLPKDFSYGEEFRNVADEFFKNLDENIMSSPNFSNARFVRNLTERVISKSALRMQMNDSECEVLELTASDFTLAVSDSEFRNINEKKKYVPIGF